MMIFCEKCADISDEIFHILHPSIVVNTWVRTLPGWMLLHAFDLDSPVRIKITFSTTWKVYNITSILSFSTYSFDFLYRITCIWKQIIKWRLNLWSAAVHQVRRGARSETPCSIYFPFELLYRFTGRLFLKVFLQEYLLQELL